LRDSTLHKKHELILPHENSALLHWNSKEDLKACDILIAEMSHQSTNTGIEIGWASAYGCRIIFVYHSETTPSGAWSYVTQEQILYQSPTDMSDKLTSLL